MNRLQVFATRSMAKARPVGGLYGWTQQVCLCLSSPCSTLAACSSLCATSVNLLVTSGAYRYQVPKFVSAIPGSELQVMCMQHISAPTNLAFPAVSLED